MDNKRIRRKRVRRFIAYGLVILTAMITATLVWCVYLWKHDPQYWTENRTFLQDTPSQDIDRMAMDAENMVFNLLSTSTSNNGESQTTQTVANNQSSSKSKTTSKTPPSPPIEKQIKLSTDQINAWLERRLPAWMSNQNFKLPEEFSHYMFHPENGQATVAFEYNKADMSKVFSLVFSITMLSEGHALVHLRQVRGGSLASPVSPAKLASLIHDDTLQRWVNEMVQGKKVDMTFPHPVESGKKITVKQLAIHSNGVIADVVTK
jgi:hypothetical protein